MTFSQKLEAVMNFSVTSVLPVVVKDPVIQDKVLPYVGLGFAGIALIEALFSHTVVPTVPATVTTVVTPINQPTA